MKSRNNYEMVTSSTTLYTRRQQTFDASIGCHEVPRDVLGTGLQLAQRGVHHADVTRHVTAAAHVEQAQRVDGAAEVAEVALDAAP